MRCCTIGGPAGPLYECAVVLERSGKVRLQMVGLVGGHDDVRISGSIDEACFSVFCFRNNSLVGIESVNRPADHMAGRRLLKHGIAISPDEIERFKFDVKALEAHVRAATLEACS